MNQPKIVCRNVWKLYGPDPEKFLAAHDGNPSTEAVKESGYIPAVRDASLEVHEGEIVVLMGLSGSGKSTLVRCMSRLIEPTAGEIEFDGEDLRAASERELVELRRHKMGMVFQHFALFPHRTVLENVAFPLEVQGVDVDTRNARALEIIDLVGLHGRGDYYPRELSGGQQQRVGIGRSLAVEPDVWFLDEPFSALDALIRRDMQDEFLRLQSTLQKTIIFITHDFDEAIRLADRIAIMRDGVIDQLGTAEELITNPGSDYVAAFTKNVSRDKLLRVHTLMGPPSEDAEGEVDGSVFVASVASQILSSSVPLRVIEDGEVVGSITAAQVNAALFESE
ncbi:MAG: glycine betaine/L-proline ABC transporter ATP-binding protein [Actinomycetota bacterium]|nr:glycine betaine/L-proline ABC transporter ATP-binding protein [Actinomycetota bacterium]MEE2957338.1 glycine betaine/L-proline ABC transporter ATP-binding protein [Actinomycetota bacterium]